jgi:transketolase
LLDKSRDTKIKTKFKPQIIGNDEEEDDYLSENEQDDEDIELLEERETEPQDEESDSEEEEVFEGAWSGDEDTESSEEEKDELSKQKWSGKDFHLTKQKKPKKETFNESKEEENEAIQLKKKRNQRITKNDVFDDTLQEAFEKQKESSEENESEEESEFTKATELTKEEKLEQIMKESPEMIELVADLKEKLKTIKEHLLPLIKK